MAVDIPLGFPEGPTLDDVEIALPTTGFGACGWGPVKGDPATLLEAESMSFELVLRGAVGPDLGVVAGEVRGKIWPVRFIL